MFFWQLLISFLVGGLFIAMQTLIAERLSLKWRGIVLTIPSTIALSFFFIGLTKTPSDAAHAVVFAPAALGIGYCFVFIFAGLSRFGFFVSLFGGFVALSLMAWALAFVPPETMFISTFLYGIPLILLAYLGVRTLPNDSWRLTAYHMNAKHIIIRVVIGGTIIGITVLLAKTISNFWGGLFSVFPAAFTSAFIIYFFLQGKSVIPAVARSLFFPGSIGFLLYAWTVRLIFPKVGIWWGTILAYTITFFFFWLFIKISYQKSIDAGAASS